MVHWAKPFEFCHENFPILKCAFLFRITIILRNFCVVKIKIDYVVSKSTIWEPKIQGKYIKTMMKNQGNKHQQWSKQILISQFIKSENHLPKVLILLYLDASRVFKFHVVLSYIIFHHFLPFIQSEICCTCILHMYISKYVVTRL